MPGKHDFDELMRRRRQRTDEGDVFESTVAKSNADASCSRQAEAEPTGSSVFTRPAHPGKTDASHAVRIPTCQSPATYEQLPAKNIADAGSSIQIPGQQSSSVFERPPLRSSADASHSCSINGAEKQAVFEKTSLRGSKSATISPRVAALARHIEDGLQDSGQVVASGAVRPRHRLRRENRDQSVQQQQQQQQQHQHEDVADAMGAEAAATAAELSGAFATAMEDSAADEAAVELPGTSITVKSRKRTADEMEETGAKCRKRNASDMEESQSLEPAQKRMRTSAWSGIGSSLRGIVKALRCPHRSEPETKQAAHR